MSHLARQGRLAGLLLAAVGWAGLVPSSHAQTVTLSLVGDSSVTAQPGVGPSSLDSGKLSTSTDVDVPGARFDQVGRGTVIDLPQRS